MIHSGLLSGLEAEPKAGKQVFSNGNPRPPTPDPKALQEVF